mmetsp:Transcript_23409/g.23644  ORF Transcript_23409/g.23644 Transcript_23409/m.23644 type:complete len:237 (-) Transcript_23409:37-747(-)
MFSNRISYVARHQIHLAAAAVPIPILIPGVLSRRMLHGSCSSLLVRRLRSSTDDAAHSYSSTATLAASSTLTTQTTQTLLINAVGLDRVGIVHDMTKEVIQVGGNVGSSQAAKLGNYFSFMMLVHVPPAPPTITSTASAATDATTTAVSAVETLTKNLQNIQDLSVIVANATATSTSTSTSATTTIGYKGRLTLEGADNPGIVNKVTKILSNNGLNIHTLETSDEVAPHGGTGKIL